MSIQPTTSVIKEEIRQAGDRLVNEAIKRILLDIVVRGHGDRLIGRWSREPELQQFLEQVPYMLDRINQLHLACTRSDRTIEQQNKKSSFERDHHRHDDHHHHHHFHHHHTDTLFSSSQSALSDFINLIGLDRHWLVRTRDPLGLTPLHKAVLFNNRPIVEYILDRYPDELAASGGVQAQNSSRDHKQRAASYIHNQGATRLINAQDKYGRSALHYAAAQLAEDAKYATASTSERLINRQLYQFLIDKGASLMVQDFRGKTPAHYARHPNQLRAKSIIHLANKLNANYQANVLSKMLRANDEKAPISERDYLAEGPNRGMIFQSSDDNWQTNCCEPNDQIQQLVSNCNRESMSVSCNDLTNLSPANNHKPNKSLLSQQQQQQQRRQPTQQKPTQKCDLAATSGDQQQQQQTNRKRSRSTNMDSSDDYAVGLYTETRDEANQVNMTEMREQEHCEQVVSRVGQSAGPSESSDEIKRENQQQMTGESRSPSPISQGISSDGSDSARADSLASSKTMNKSNLSEQDELSVALKGLISDRCQNGRVIDQRTKQSIKRALNDGVINRINELLTDGYGNYLINEAATSCWNQQCKRYINQVVPSLLIRLDTLHELIALNQLVAMKTLLNKDPILARIRRPYKRAAMSALHVAVWRDRRLVVKYLLGRFPELVGQRDSHGATCLHWAAKCLSHDRLYCWLLEHFGHQLEHVRDWRGKTALDYHQQAFRLSNYAENHPTHKNYLAKQSAMDVSDILRNTQRASDRLQFRGDKVSIRGRTKPVPLNATQTTTRIVEQPPNANHSIWQPLSAEVALGADSGSHSSLAGSCPGDLDRSIEIAIDLASPEARANNRETSPSTTTASEERASVNSGEGNVGAVSRCQPIDSDRSESGARVSFFRGQEQVIRGHAHQQLQSSEPATKPPSKPEAEAINLEFNDKLNQELIGEMVQLDSNELQIDKTDQDAVFVEAREISGSPLSTSSLALSRPQSASFANTLDAMMENFFKKDDFKKLEHLILAGCGGRLLKLYASKYRRTPAAAAAAAAAAAVATAQSSSIDGQQMAEVSLKMREFCEKKAPDLIARVTQIHQVLHKCFAKPTNKLAQTGPLNLEGANNVFHKLCNLLVRRRLIMSRDCYGASPLHVALMRADRRLVDYLLRRHPESASAPDHDQRNSIHYAALVLAAYEAHGSFKLTTTTTNSQLDASRGDSLSSSSSSSSSMSDGDDWSGFWQIDENVEVMYSNLVARYGDLLEIKDRKGLTGSDYIVNSANLSQEHVSLREHMAATSGEHVPVDVLANCCPEYAQMLARYNYVIFNERDESIVVAERPLEAVSLEEPARLEPKSIGQQQQQQQQSVKQSTGNNEMTPSDKRRLAGKRLESFDQQASVERSERDICNAPLPANSKTAKQVMASARSKTADELVRQLDQAVELRPPDLLVPLEAPVVRQVAPKPTVGVDSGFAQLTGQTQSLKYAPSPDSTGLSSNLQAASSHSASSRRHHSSHNHTGSLLDDLDPNQPSRRANHQQRQHHHRHRHRRNKHRHHHHHHHHHKRKTQQPLVQSIVGGVIVPTIIHNDKMDEIETYDIIYRRPPTATQKQTSNATTSSFSSESSCSLSLASESDSADSDCGGGVLKASSRLAAGKPACSASSGKASPAASGRSQRASAEHLASTLIATGSGLSVSAMASPNLSSSSSSSSSSSGGGGGNRASSNGDLDEDVDEKDCEEDDRVERLSNEFENRVRKEKSELRAKVDQIMNEIKLSAKSGKSSRFLASPADLTTTITTNPKTVLDNESTVMFATTATTNERAKIRGENDGATPRANQKLAKSGLNSKRQSVESHSSGHCSERTYDTSVTSSASSSTSSRCSNNGAAVSVSLGSLSASSKRTSTGGSCSSVVSSSSSKLNGSTRAAKLVSAGQQQQQQQQASSIIQKQVITEEQRPVSASEQQSGKSNLRVLAQNNALKSGSISTSISELAGQLVSKNTYGQTYLHFIASRSQSASTLYKVLDHGCHLIGERDIFYRTARDVAAQFHLANNVQVLDKFIIDLFINENTSLLRHLLNQGYSPLIHVSDTDGNDIMLILKLLKLDRMIHFLLQMADFQRWRDELHTFIRNGYSAGLTELIRKHADLVRAKSVHARTALHLAILFDRLDMASELIERVPSCVHLTDNMGRTALHYTYGLNLKNVEGLRELLLKNGASLEARDVKMRTPKYYFIFKREIEEIKRIELELN